MKPTKDTCKCCLDLKLIKDIPDPYYYCRKESKPVSEILSCPRVRHSEFQRYEILIKCISGKKSYVIGLTDIESVKNIFDPVLSTLTDREQAVIRLRWGLIGNRARSLLEIGMAYNVTRERIRQIEAKAIRKLRHPIRWHQLKSCLLNIDKIELEGSLIIDKLMEENCDDCLYSRSFQKDSGIHYYCQLRPIDWANTSHLKKCPITGSV